VLGFIVLYLGLIALSTWLLHKVFPSGSYQLRQESEVASVGDCDPEFDSHQDSGVIKKWARELQEADPVFVQHAVATTRSHSPSVSSSVYLETCLGSDNPPPGNPFRTPESLPQLELPPVAIKLNPLGPMTRSRAVGRKTYF
jgi:hypothetical protein